MSERRERVGRPSDAPPSRPHGGRRRGASHDRPSAGPTIALTRAMAQDHGPERIRVNALAPGFHDTGMVDDYFDAQPDGAAARTRIEGLMAVRRIGRPEELARTAAFLLSDANGYMTAASIVLDGAMSAGYTWSVE